MKKFLQGFFLAFFSLMIFSAGAAIVTGTGFFGTQTNDNAAAGYIGEYQTATLTSASAVSMTTASAVGITSVTLGAGDWDVQGTVCYHGSGTTNISDVKQAVTAASGVISTTPGTFTYDYIGLVVTDDGCYVSPTTRMSLAASAPVYLSSVSDFTVSTETAYGALRARRVR